ncbi:helix-turn-helix domain-containing protein [Nocardia sp. NPDC051756]|uniref:helix-turn-helix transcriptional regulator n=1 Tax=Nocardia sp. NPDC051756 TaxID=3154751 RepID=UPI00343080FE
MAVPRRVKRPSTGSVADAFIARRHELRLTQADLADLAGVSRSSVQALEAGQASVRLSLVQEIAAALGCDLILATRSGVRIAG